MSRLVEPLRALLRVLYRLLPKRDHATIWGWPDYEDSVLALEVALRNTRLKRVYLLMTDPSAEPPHELGPRTVRVKKDSLRGWTVFLFARFPFFTHRCYMRSFPRNVVSVNVWHGMPIKRIGWLLDDDPAVEARYTLATSDFWADIVQRSLRPWDRVLVTGLPRNDRLFVGAGDVPAALRVPDGVDHLVTWLPTYRRSTVGYLTVDGRPTGSVFELEGVDPGQLNQRLVDLGAFAIVKPHPMTGFRGEQRWSNLLVLDSDSLTDRGVSLYQLLAATDVLISDVSSVTIDFLLLDRPIIHAVADLAEYGATRGFSVDRIDDVLAGPVVTDVEELIAVLGRVLSGEDPEADRRRRVRSLSHADLDDAAAARLLAAIGL